MILLFAPVWTLFCLIMAGFGGWRLGMTLYAVGATASVAVILLEFMLFELRRKFRRHGVF